tara:strand:+ start:69 stop:749 length:681 start_codon:yes stop_codon:yes gene_type:complete
MSTKEEEPPKKKSKGRGRKGKLTKDVIQIVATALEKGATHKIAMQAAGITAPTFYRWMNKGEQGEAQFKDFFDAVKASESQGALKHLANIERHSNDDWRASAWLLERKWRYVKDPKVEEGAPKVEEQDSPVMGTARQILSDQYVQLSKAAADALKTGSFQAFAALKRQEYHLALDLRKEEEKENSGMFSDMNDDQILSEIEGLLMALPPVLKQRIESSIISKKLKL